MVRNRLGNNRVNGNLNSAGNQFQGNINHEPILEENQIRDDLDEDVPENNNNAHARQQLHQAQPEGVLLCPVPTCTLNNTYASQISLKKHLNEQHTDYQGVVEGFSRCNFAGCGQYCIGRGLGQHKMSAHRNGANPAVRVAAAPVAANQDEQAAEIASNLQLAQVSDEDLISFYTTPLKWITTACPDIAHAATLAFFLLPGLIKRHQEYKLICKTSHLRMALSRDTVEVVSLLNSFCANLQPSSVATKILQHARFLHNVFPEHHIHRDARNQTTVSIISRMTRRIERSCAEGRLSQGTRSLCTLEGMLKANDSNNPNSLQPLQQPNTRELIQTFYPPATDHDDVSGDVDTPIPLIIIEEDAVRAKLQSLNIDRSEGNSGWSNIALKALGTRGSEEQISSFVKRLTAVFNHLLTGTADIKVHNLWMQARVAFIDKNDGSGRYRPLGIGETVYRCFASVVTSSVGKAVADVLLPLQLGTGVPGGVEIAAILADLGYSSRDVATTSIDITNAYNTIHRKDVLKGLASKCPQLIPLFKWAYGRPIVLRDHRGKIVGYASTGLLQGDPLATLFFCVGSFEGLKLLEDKLREIERQLAVPEESRGYVIAIADDITIICCTAVAFLLARHIDGILLPYGLKLNLAKSFIIARSLNEILEHPPGWTILPDGRKTLGRPLGSDIFQEQFIQQQIEAKLPPLLALQRIAPHYAFRLLKYSLNHRLDYLWRVTAGILGDLFKSFDHSINDAILTIVGCTGARHNIDPLMIDRLRALPLNLGGLGIPKVADYEGIRHKLIAYERARVFLSSYHPAWIPTLDRRYGPGQVAQFPFTIEAIEQATLALDEGYDEDLKRLAAATRTIVNESHQQVQRGIAAQLSRDTSSETHAAAALFRSAETSTAGAWLRLFTDPFITRSRWPRDAVFQDALRARLLIPPFISSVDHDKACNCSLSQPLLASQKPFHSLVCSGSYAFITERHNAIRDELIHLLRRVSPFGTRVSGEPISHGGVPFTHRPDIAIEKNGIVSYIDVVVADPTSTEALNSSDRSSHLIAGRAAALAAHRKTLLYARENESRDDQNRFNVTPFALESTGRFETTAIAYLGNLCKDHPKALRSFYRNCSLITAHALGRCLKFGRLRFLPAP
jgi:hypothetical protein